MSNISEILNVVERSRTIVNEIMKYGVNEECIARIIQGLAMESEDHLFTKSILELTKNKITSLQNLQNEENENKEKQQTKKIIF